MYEGEQLINEEEAIKLFENKKAIPYSVLNKVILL
jgi:hypothetical protein